MVSRPGFNRRQPPSGGAPGRNYSALCVEACRPPPINLRLRIAAVKVSLERLLHSPSLPNWAGQVRRQGWVSFAISVTGGAIVGGASLLGLHRWVPGPDYAAMTERCLAPIVECQKELLHSAFAPSRDLAATEVAEWIDRNRFVLGGAIGFASALALHLALQLRGLRDKDLLPKSVEEDIRALKANLEQMERAIGELFRLGQHAADKPRMLIRADRGGMPQIRMDQHWAVMTVREWPVVPSSGELAELIAVTRNGIPSLPILLDPGSARDPADQWVHACQLAQLASNRLFEILDGYVANGIGLDN
jgi:hypothetical protein